MEDIVEKKKRKGSKNKKKNWRKHADVADVEEHLENVRKEERTGGPAAEFQDEQLFFVDKDNEKDTKKGKKRITEDDDEDDDEEVYISKKKRLMQNLKRVKDNEKKEVENRKAAKVVNVWGQEVMAVQNLFLESTVKRPKVKPNTVGTGKMNIEAVAKPDAGISYNPDYDSHQNLLNKVAENKEKKNKELRKLNSKVKKVSVEELKKQSEIWLKEMSQGLNMNDQEEEDDSDDDTGEENTISTKDKVRKTKQQKRKQKMVISQGRQRLKAKLTKEKLNELFRLKSIKKEIRREEAEREQRIKERLQTQNDNENTRTKRLGKHKYEDGPLTFQLSHDLAGSLRGMKPGGNLIKDRFKSFQKRNMIEVRRPVLPHRKYKRKVYTRKSYNAPTIRDFNPAEIKGPPKKK